MADTKSASKPFQWLGSTHTYRDDGGFITLKHGDTVQLTDEEAKSARFDGKVAPIAVQAETPKVQALVSTSLPPPSPQPTPAPEPSVSPTSAAPAASREEEITAALTGTVPQAITYVNSLATVDLAAARRIEQQGSARASVLKIIDGRIAAATTKA